MYTLFVNDQTAARLIQTLALYSAMEAVGMWQPETTTRFISDLTPIVGTEIAQTFSSLIEMNRPREANGGQRVPISIQVRFGQNEPELVQEEELTESDQAFARWATLADRWLDAAGVMEMPFSEFEAEVLSKGCQLRTLIEDGNRFMFTADRNPLRVNVEVEKGKVVRAWRG